MDHRKRARRKWEQNSDDEAEEEKQRQEEQAREKDQLEKEEFAERLRLKDEEKTRKIMEAKISKEELEVHLRLAHNLSLNRVLIFIHLLILFISPCLKAGHKEAEGRSQRGGEYMP